MTFTIQPSRFGTAVNRRHIRRDGRPLGEPRTIRQAYQSMAEPSPPYDTSVYPGIWECPDGVVDPRHVYWLADVLAAGWFRTALELGSFPGTSGTAFVEAVNAGRLEHATFCDLEPRGPLRRVLATCRDPTR